VVPSRTRLALATCAAYPHLPDDDRHLLASLAARGIAGEPVPWRGDAAWEAYDGVLLRSPWDYFEHLPEFVAWLARLEARGVPVVPTLWIHPEDGATAEDAVARVRATGWPEVVVKPTVSAGSWRTLRLAADEVGSRLGEIREILSGSGLMAQPFLPEVVEQGEWSLVFFRGAWSHAVVKRPREGDFRVQWTHGGRHAGAAPPAGLVEQARAALAAAPSPGLYARVDGVVRDGRFLLMELEQIEPYLFFGECPGSSDRFVEAILREMAGRSP
jgi:hypothetical protein